MSKTPICITGKPVHLESSKGDPKCVRIKLLSPSSEVWFCDYVAGDIIEIEAIRNSEFVFLAGFSDRMDNDKIRACISKCFAEIPTNGQFREFCNSSWPQIERMLSFVG